MPTVMINNNKKVKNYNGLRNYNNSYNMLKLTQQIKVPLPVRERKMKMIMKMIIVNSSNLIVLNIIENPSLNIAKTMEVKRVVSKVLKLTDL